MTTPSARQRIPSTSSLSPSLAGKLRRLRMFPMLTILARLGIAQRLHRERTAWAFNALRRQGLEDLLTGGEPDALPQDPADLLFLYRTILRRRPRRIIELGSGKSTVFIAQAISDGGVGHLWSLDADERWLSNTRQMLPAPLRPLVTLVHSPVELNTDYGVAAWQYRLIPEGEWDFVVVDGPAGTAESSLSCDLVHLAPKIRRGGGGFIDHRCKTVILAKSVLGERLGIRYMPSLESFWVHASQ